MSGACTSSYSDEELQQECMDNISNDSKETMFVDVKRPNRLLDVACQSWKSGLYTDVTIIVGGERFPAHQLVLASLSDYFPPLLKLDETEAGEITLHGVEPDDFSVLLKYAYTGDVDITKGTVQSVLIAADYLSIVYVKEACVRFMAAHLDVDNVCDALVFGVDYPLLELVDSVKQFLKENLDEVSKNVRFSQVDPEFLRVFFEDDNLILYSNKVTLKSRDREKSILVSVLRYLTRRQGCDPQIIEMMIRTVRLTQISKDLILECLKNFPALEGNKIVRKYVELRDVADSRGQEGKKKHPAKYKAQSVDTDIPETWFRRRKLASFSLYQKTFRYAAGGQIQATPHPPLAFNSDVNSEICRIDIWLREWDDKVVIGGLRLTYSDGSGKNNLVNQKGHCRGEQDHHFVELEPGENIVKVVIGSGFLIDRLGFQTNRGRICGPFGGPGGSEYTEVAPTDSLAYLFDINCDSVQTQGQQAIFNLMLRWITVY